MYNDDNGVKLLDISHNYNYSSLIRVVCCNTVIVFPSCFNLQNRFAT